jgi:hypothetical protein
MQPSKLKLESKLSGLCCLLRHGSGIEPGPLNLSIGMIAKTAFIAVGGPPKYMN